MPDRSTTEAEPADPHDGAGRQVQLTVTLGAPGTERWHARVVMADASVIEFASPFELARFLAWPLAVPTTDRGGLR